MERVETVHDGLRVRGLSKTYKNGVQAMQGIDLEVASGMYGLLGPNGAGKSTLMRTLATLQQPDSGHFSFDGTDGLADADGLRATLGYLPQQIGAYPGVSGRSLLDRFAWLKGNTERSTRDAEVAHLLERVNLVEAADRKVSTYSGGMLRRFGIALALLGRPRFLIVDEPTAGLDPAERNRFYEVLADVSTDAVVLLSTHIVEDVETLCERLSILAAGAIIAEGKPAELCAALEGTLWSRIVPRGEALPEGFVHSKAAPTGTRVIMRAETQPGNEWQAHEPRLEDVYHLALAGHA
ncbi:MAG: ABC transporter ATP-binding protein [Myxococcota bacterium]